MPADPLTEAQHAMRAELMARAADYEARCLAAADDAPPTFFAAPDLADPAGFEHRFGVARALVPAVDLMLKALPAPERATLPREMLQAADGLVIDSAVATRMVLWLLEDPAHGVRAMAADGVVTESLDAVAGAHRSVLRGRDLGKTEWRAVRRVGLLDASQARLNLILASVVEAAAWPCSTSAVVLFQTLERWLVVTGVLVERELGWSIDDMETLTRTYGAIVEEAEAKRKAGLPHESPADVFEAREAELARRWTAVTDLRKARSRARMLDLKQVLLAELSRHDGAREPARAALA